MHSKSIKSLLPLWASACLILTLLHSAYSQPPAAAFPAGERTEQPSALQQIAADFSQNRLSVDEWAKLSLYSIFDPQKLPTPYSQLPPGSLTTPFITQLFQVWDQLNAATRQELQQYGLTASGAFSPPTNLPDTAGTTHFLFHYSTEPGDTNAVDATDANANGIPDYVETMMAVFEQVYTVLVDSMGYAAPPSDSGKIGEDARYDIYLLKEEPGVLGVTYPYITIKDNPNSTGITEKNATMSYIGMRNDYTEGFSDPALELIQVTAAHEFFHAVQMGYDVFEKAWLAEATATWIEDEVYDDANQNIFYLTKWFRFPYYPLDATPSEFKNRWYGSWIFFRYVSEHLGGRKTIRRIWEISTGYDSKIKDYSFTAIDDALQEVGSDFASAFKDFSVANLFQTVAPYDYEEADLYPPVHISESLFRTRRDLRMLSRRRSARYLQIFPNALPGDVDEIEFTVSPQNQAARLELLVAARQGQTVSVFDVFPSGGILNFSLNNSSTYDEIYAIIVNLDTLKTEVYLDVDYKSNLVRLSTSGEFLHAQVANDYLIFKRLVRFVNMEGEPQTDLIISRFNLFGGYVRDITFPFVDAADVFLARRNGEMLIDLYDYRNDLHKKYGYRLASLNQLKGDFEILQLPAVDHNTVYFYGSLNDKDFKKGIFVSDLTSGPPRLLLDLTDTDEKIDLIVGDQSTFVALKNSPGNPNSDELIALINASVQPFYRPDSGKRIQSLVYDDGFATWSESDGAFSQTSIKAYDFAKARLIEIRSNSGVDPYSVNTAGKRVVWWENTGGATKIQLWESDSIKTLRSTFSGLYLDDNGVSANAFDIPMDRKGVAWMETDFTLYYYHFATESLNRYDLSGYFTDRFLTNYLVKVSGKNIVIQALSATANEKTGIYLFRLQDPVTGIRADAEKPSERPAQFALFQNYPNPFNPVTRITYRLPRAARVSLNIYDLTGRRVKSLVQARQPASTYTVLWNGTNDAGQRVASGIYFYRLQAGDFMQIRRMVLLR